MAHRFAWEDAYNVQEEEDRDYELNARYDYQREAFGDLGDDPETLRAEMAALDRYHAELAMDEMEARGGPRLWDLDETPF